MEDGDGTSKDNTQEIRKNLNGAIFAIISEYTRKLCGVFECENNAGNMLPIGFLPSAVLSNWCLSKFDKGILDFWNPSYYGRYVDDIIIVEKVEKDSEVYELARKNQLKKDVVLYYYLANGRRKKTCCFAHKKTKLSERTHKTNECLENVDIANNKNGTAERTKDTTYSISKEFCLSEKSNFEFQMEKTRVIMLFADNNSGAILEKFKQEIYENISEFRLLPEMDNAFEKDDFSSFYSLENDATVNKLRGVKNITLSKYELSKFLGKYRIVSSLIDKEKEKGFTHKIRSMFNASELIDNYIHWERLFEIFITDKDYDGLIAFSKQIHDSIEALEIAQKEAHKNDKNMSSPIKDSLQKHLDSSLNRTLALFWGKEAERVRSTIILNCRLNVNILLRMKYLRSRMTNRYAFSLPVDNIKFPVNDTFDKSKVNFTDFDETLLFLSTIDIRDNDEDVLFPYYPRAQDIGLEMFIKDILGEPSERKTH